MRVRPSKIQMSSAADGGEDGRAGVDEGGQARRATPPRPRRRRVGSRTRRTVCHTASTASRRPGDRVTPPPCDHPHVRAGRQGVGEGRNQPADIRTQQLAAEQEDRGHDQGAGHQREPAEDAEQVRPTSASQAAAPVERQRRVGERQVHPVPGDGRRQRPARVLDGAGHGHEQATVVDREVSQGDRDGADHEAREGDQAEEQPRHPGRRRPGIGQSGRHSGRYRIWVSSR